MEIPVVGRLEPLPDAVDGSAYRQDRGRLGRAAIRLRIFRARVRLYVRIRQISAADGEKLMDAADELADEWYETLRESMIVGRWWSRFRRRSRDWRRLERWV